MIIQKGFSHEHYLIESVKRLMIWFPVSPSGNGKANVFLIFVSSRATLLCRRATRERFLGLGAPTETSEFLQRADYLILLIIFPLCLHVELRKRSILELKATFLYAALVTSLYFARAVGKQRLLESHEDRQRIAEFLQEQNALQRTLLVSLRK